MMEDLKDPYSLWSIEFLFGTADQSDVDSLKADVKQLYENQIDQTQMQHDMTLMREYLNIHSTGRLNPNIIDPIHLR